MSAPTLTDADFPAFFKAVWNVDPFPWQADLITRLHRAFAGHRDAQPSDRIPENIGA